MKYEAKAQADSTSIERGVIVLLTTHDDIEYIGKILSKDSREVVILTSDNEEIAIPRYQVKEIKELDNNDISQDGYYIPEEVFATRYVLTTNAISLPKGESYIVWNLYGPDIQFGIGDHISVGLMTTWFGIPLFGNIKYSTPIGEDLHAGAGLLLGSGTWAAPDLFMALPYGVVTLGDRRTNISFSAGYGFVGFDGENGESALFSVGAMV